MTISRNLEGPLLKLAGSMPVVAVTGPRQSGKTTLCRTAFPDLSYVSLEPVDVRDYARKDPRGFLEEHRAGAIFDEVQNAPGLLSYLQVEVDENPATRNHLWILAGMIALSLAIEIVYRGVTGRKLRLGGARR